MKDLPRYQQIVDSLAHDIRRGQFKPGHKLPSEAGLVKKFQTSRITIGRALRELQHLGLISRRAGSGTYVADTVPIDRALLFGLLIPDLGQVEVIEHICRGIAGAPEAVDHALLWGHTDDRDPDKGRQCLKLAAQFVDRRVDGVFFVPLEFEQGADKINRQVLNVLKDASIPVVMIDRRPQKLPARMRTDIVGLDSRQAGWEATEHLIKLGCQRIGFLSYQSEASTINARFSGYQEALRAHGLRDAVNAVFDPASIKSPDDRDIEAYVCVNDHVAALFMRTFLAARRLRVPEDLRFVGIDDVGYAGLLPVPLTTIRQPCRQIGEAAMRAMIERIRQPDLPSREILLQGELIVRESCGCRLSPACVSEIEDLLAMSIPN